MAIRPFIFLRSGGEPLLEHEKVHIEQQERLGLIRYLLKYTFSKKFRYDMEVEAYVKGNKMSISYANDFVSLRYKS